jgi:hypothetical protein
MIRGDMIAIMSLNRNTETMAQHANNAGVIDV